ncbi:MAG: ribonuclease D [Actinobacteria bacterium]|nr:ribonuclease D [Actinomycetota bacterium]
MELTPMLAPIDGTPEVIATEDDFAHAIAILANGHGPFAIDAERASGYKYSQRAYLIQIKRAGGGLHLIDPIPFQSNSLHPLFLELNALIQSDEVILHASTQDLPCLREVGIQPATLFDTELAGRLAGLPRVGLGALVESLIGIGLAKEHSAVDWSIRPLPIAWLTYAALDVELLIELRVKMIELLSTQGKLGWAHEEFAAILAAAPSEKRKEPWRRTSGMHKVRKRQVLAIVRELWRVRDDLARSVDVAPSKMLSDAALMELALHTPKDRKEIEKVLRPIGARSRWYENAPAWLLAIELGLALPESEWPELRLVSDSMPPMKLWKERFPAKFAPLSHARLGIAGESALLGLPPENLISPEIVRRLCWNPPTGSTEVLQVNEVARALTELGARPWQVLAVAPILATALLEKEPVLALVPPIENSDVPESPDM